MMEPMLRSDEANVLDDLHELDGMDTLTIEVNQGLEEALGELGRLKDEVGAFGGESLIEQCKNTVIDTVVGQFGIASMLISAKDGGSVTTTHNFEKGITSTGLDAERYRMYMESTDGTAEWKNIRRTTGYDKTLPEMRKARFKEGSVITDDYTGKALHKDGRTHIDHVVSAKEIESAAANHLHLSVEERAKLATMEANLAFTEGSLNQSKGDAKMSEWLEKQDRKTGTTKADKYDVDVEKAKAADKRARDAITKKITVSAVKKYSSELLVTGGADAARTAVHSALGIIMKEVAEGVFLALKKAFKEKGVTGFKGGYKVFKAEMNGVIDRVKPKWKDVLTGSFEAGVTAFLSNIVVFLINLFATTLKKFVAMIRAGFVSLAQAVKMMANPPKGMTKEEARYQALKIFTAGVIGAASLGLAAGIEKLLQSIPLLQPLMMLPVPSIGDVPQTLSDVLAVTISAVLGGLVTTVVIYLMDKFRGDAKKNKLEIQLLYQSGVVVDYRVAQSWFVLDEAYKHLVNSAVEMKKDLEDSRGYMKESCAEVAKSSEAYSDALAKLRARRDKRK